tara:strand:+ start:90 stop:350 length:261 start_codon:yes stop_codon:yes gene_type:complete
MKNNEKEKNMRTVIQENSRGVQLVQRDTHWSIIKPVEFGYRIAVYHVGHEKYIKRIWNTRFCNQSYFNDHGQLIEKHGKYISELLV